MEQPNKKTVNFLQMSYTGTHSSRESLIICGDFNMEPLSPVYEFVVVGELEYVGIPQNEMSGRGRTGGRPMPHAFIPPMANVTADCLLPIEYTRRKYRKLEITSYLLIE